MIDHMPSIYSLLPQKQKDQVEAAMKEYNGTSLDETFTDPEDFFNKVYRSKETLIHDTRRGL